MMRNQDVAGLTKSRELVSDPVKRDPQTVLLLLPRNARRLDSSARTSDVRDSTSSVPSSQQQVTKENMADPKRTSTSSQHQSLKPLDIRSSAPDVHPGTSPSALTFEEPGLIKYEYDQGFAKAPYPRPLDMNLNSIMRTQLPRTSHIQFPLPSSLIRSDQKLWWDDFLRTYP
ncbi:hypothetical protein K435DRAFT_53370 [Dendrothele bispora CBS 962.96]|uniref:Uncharacterized protein n=1 Tax=Dendrothele bispora (strain CBS 962.96) TaxID=1314807 RepID=A0A4S8KS23_DENBC|nr:hypothetical protein K435DRAFT_53370 [Dendrothele bispora CBS 962.96]